MKIKVNNTIIETDEISHIVDETTREYGGVICHMKNGKEITLIPVKYRLHLGLDADREYMQNTKNIITTFSELLEVKNIL